MKRSIFAVIITTMLVLLVYWGSKKIVFEYSVEKEFHLPNQSSTTWRSGDIIFQTSQSSLSQAIQLATKSKYSHVGMIYENDGQWQVLEAVEPVKLTPITDWILRGESGHYVVKRLKNVDALITEQVLASMKQIGKKNLGKHYDATFEWNDDKMYCSELVWKIYKQSADIEIGSLEKLSDFDLSSELVQAKIKERYGDRIPYEENVISPKAIFESDLLITVDEK